MSDEENMEIFLHALARILSEAPERFRHFGFTIIACDPIGYVASISNLEDGESRELVNHWMTKKPSKMWLEIPKGKLQ